MNCYYQRARDDFGVRFIHSRPHSTFCALKVQKICHCPIRSTVRANRLTEEFDMVVLSTGFKVSDEARVLAEKAGTRTERQYFPCYTRVSTRSRPADPGVYVCWNFTGTEGYS